MRPAFPLILLYVLVLVACERTRPTPSPTAPPEDGPSTPNALSKRDAPSDGDVRDGGEDGPDFGELRGEVVRVSRPVVMHAVDDLVLEVQRWEHAGQSGRAWRVRAPRSARARVVASETVEPLRALLPDDPGPFAAINGGFYEAIENAPPDQPAYRAMGLVISDAEMISKKTVRGGSGIFVFDAGRSSIVHRDAFDRHPRQALQSIDRIVADGASRVTKREGASRAARSAVVVGEEHLWLVALAEDTAIRGGGDAVRLAWTRERGLTLWAFAQYLMETTDAVDALNLDGGVSTQLTVRDGAYRFELAGVRGTINALVVRPR